MLFILEVILVVFALIWVYNSAYSDGFIDGASAAYTEMKARRAAPVVRPSVPPPAYKGVSHIKTWTPERIKIDGLG